MASTGHFRNFENQIVGEFLMSTNVFKEWEGVPAPVRYYGLRAASPPICDNPFTVFDEE